MNKQQLGMAVGLAAVLVASTWYYSRPGHRPAPAPAVEQARLPAAHYVGSGACARCHAGQYAAWRGSQHAVAMQKATAATVLGDFNDARFGQGDSQVRFFRDGDAFKIHAAGPDGKPADFTVRYTFGIAPLQQYLIEFPRGRLQSLTIAWDSRPHEDGGQHWFDLYRGQDIRPGNPLHWTGIDQNWNYQCADCHSTHLRKRFDAAGDRFDTTWSEINVACEACHGPGSAHVAWAQSRPAGGVPSGDPRLTARLDERRGIHWTIDAATGNARRSAPRTSSVEIEVCARCHSRRGQFTDEHVAGQPLDDAYRPALIEPGLYWPDGQMRDEVYNYASFLTSRMASRGVTCSDCHDPHSGKLRLPGNTVCAQCHLAAKYDSPAHHHHAAGTPGARCADCHMPATTYMVVDPRHDHSFRIPRPDRSVSLGVPNACSRCHRDRDAAWAAARVRQWYPDGNPGFQVFAETFAASDRGDGRVRASLVALAEDGDAPPMVRASALWRLGRAPAPDMLTAVRKGLHDADANVRTAAVEALAGADAGLLADLLPPLLADPIRLVRMSAARTLAGAGEARLAEAQRGTFERALAEYVDAQGFNADRPEAHANLGLLAAVRGDTTGAEREFRAALAVDPTFSPAWVNLADLKRAQGDEAGAESVLREGLGHAPDDAALHHALGLSLVRSGKLPQALLELRTAVREAPDDARRAYVYAIALHSAGRVDAALDVLRANLERHPGNRDTLLALTTINRDAGRRGRALEYASELAKGYPQDPQAAALLQALR